MSTWPARTRRALAGPSRARAGAPADVPGDAERARLARDLHDGLQQRLVAVRIGLGLARDRVGDDAVLGDSLDALGLAVEDAIDELREVAHGIHPHVLTDLGLPAALAGVGRQAPVPVTVRAGGVGRHPAELESAVYFCCREAIQNATKHGGSAVRVSVTLREEAGELRFTAFDDGPGFTPSSADRGAGLQNMQERLAALGGRLSIVSSPGWGTVVSGAVPL